MVIHFVTLVRFLGLSFFSVLYVLEFEERGMEMAFGRLGQKGEILRCNHEWLKGVKEGTAINEWLSEREQKMTRESNDNKLFLKGRFQKTLAKLSSTSLIAFLLAHWLPLWPLAPYLTFKFLWVAIHNKVLAVVKSTPPPSSTKMPKCIFRAANIVTCFQKCWI